MSQNNKNKKKATQISSEIACSIEFVKSIFIFGLGSASRESKESRCQYKLRKISIQNII